MPQPHRTPSPEFAAILDTLMYINYSVNRQWASAEQAARLYGQSMDCVEMERRYQMEVSSRG